MSRVLHRHLRQQVRTARSGPALLTAVCSGLASLTAFYFSLLDWQDVSYGAVRWQNTLCSALLKCCVGDFKPALKACKMNRKAESSRAVWGGDLSTATAGERWRICRLVLPASWLLTGCGCCCSLSLCCRCRHFCSAGRAVSGAGGAGML